MRLLCVQEIPDPLLVLVGILGDIIPRRSLERAGTLNTTCIHQLASEVIVGFLVSSVEFLELLRVHVFIDLLKRLSGNTLEDVSDT